MNLSPNLKPLTRNLQPAPPALTAPRPAAVLPQPRPVSEYRVRIGNRVFQGNDVRGLLKLAVEAHRSSRCSGRQSS